MNESCDYHVTTIPLPKKNWIPIVADTRFRDISNLTLSLLP